MRNFKTGAFRLIKSEDSSWNGIALTAQPQAPA
jgi:hypothetical protein